MARTRASEVNSEFKFKGKGHRSPRCLAPAQLWAPEIRLIFPLLFKGHFSVNHLQDLSWHSSQECVQVSFIGREKE